MKKRPAKSAAKASNWAVILGFASSTPPRAKTGFDQLVIRARISC
jgi:hypothetical protein